MRKYILYLVIFFGFAVIGGYIKSTYWVTTNKMSDSLNQANVQINQFSMKNNVHMKQEKYIELAVNLKINALEQGALNSSIDSANIKLQQIFFNLPSGSNELNTEQLKKHIDTLNRIMNDPDIIHGLNQSRFSPATINKLERIMFVKTKLETVLLFRLAKQL